MATWYVTVPCESKATHRWTLVADTDTQAIMQALNLAEELAPQWGEPLAVICHRWRSEGPLHHFPIPTVLGRVTGPGQLDLTRPEQSGRAPRN